MSKKKKKPNPSLGVANENIQKEIISKMYYCEKCKKPLIEEIFFLGFKQEAVYEKSRPIKCVYCH